MSDNIYKEQEQIPGLSQPKLSIAIPQEQGKGQDNLAIGAAGSSHVKALESGSKGASTRLQAIETVLQAIYHPKKCLNKNSHGASQTAKTPTTKAPSTDSMMEDVEENYEFGYARFLNVINTDDNISQLVRQSVDHAELYKGFLRHEAYRHMRRELELLVKETFELHKELGNVACLVLDLQARHEDHRNCLQEFAESLGQGAEYTIRNIPAKTLRTRYPTMYNRRPAAVIAADQQHRAPPPPTYPRDSGRCTPPHQRYDPSNPRWDGQRPHFKLHGPCATSEWFSMWTPRKEYKHHQCKFCKLYGHIQWNCPQYACPHCRKACGHKPIHCLKRPEQHDGRDANIHRVETPQVRFNENIFVRKILKPTITEQSFNIAARTAIRGRGRPEPYMRMTTRPRGRGRRRNPQDQNIPFPPLATTTPPSYNEATRERERSPPYDPCNDPDWDDSILDLYQTDDGARDY